MYTSFDSKRYAERNKVETTSSVIKRKFGEGLKARKFWYQVKEIKIKLILHNLTKAIQAIVVVVVVEEFNKVMRRDISHVFVRRLLPGQSPHGIPF